MGSPGSGHASRLLPRAKRGRASLVPLRKSGVALRLPCSLHVMFPSSSRRDAGKVARGVRRTPDDPWKAKHKAFAPRQGRGEPACPDPFHGGNTDVRSNCAAVPRTSAEVRILYNFAGSRGARSTATPGYLPGVPPGRPRGKPFPRQTRRYATTILVGSGCSTLFVRSRRLSPQKSASPHRREWRGIWPQPQPPWRGAANTPTEPSPLRPRT